MIVVLHPEQAEQARQIAADLEMSVSDVVRHLLSGPLARMVEKEFAA